MTDVLGAGVVHLDSAIEGHLMDHPLQEAAPSFTRVHQQPERSGMQQREDHARDAGATPQVHASLQNAACGRDVPGRMTTQFFNTGAPEDTGRTGRDPRGVQPIPVGITHRLMPG